MNSFNKVILHSPPLANQPIKDLDEYQNPEKNVYVYEHKAQIENEAISKKNILSVSSEPPTIIRQRTC